MTNEEYLVRILSDKEMQKRELEVELRVFLAKNKAESDVLSKDIDSIKKQLDSYKNPQID